MSLIAKGGKSFEPAPEGLHAGVCVDVVDLGMKETAWGSKHKCRIVWELSERMNDGRPFIASKQYTVSLHEKSSLYKDLKAWRGRAFTQEELAGFDLEKVIGAPCQILIVHEERDGTTYGNVSIVTKADKRHILKPSGSYVRKSAAPIEEEREPDENEDSYIDGSDIPF